MKLLGFNINATNTNIYKSRNFMKLLGLFALDGGFAISTRVEIL